MNTMQTSQKNEENSSTKNVEIEDETLLEKLKLLLTGEVIHSLEAIKLVQE